MKKILAAVLSLLCAASVFAFDNDDSIVRWRGIVGVITAPAVDTPVGSIHGGTLVRSQRSRKREPRYRKCLLRSRSAGAQRRNCQWLCCAKISP
jgi:hypothetical protein